MIMDTHHKLFNLSWVCLFEYNIIWMHCFFLNVLSWACVSCLETMYDDKSRSKSGHLFAWGKSGCAVTMHHELGTNESKYRWGQGSSPEDKASVRFSKAHEVTQHYGETRNASLLAYQIRTINCSKVREIALINTFK